MKKHLNYWLALALLLPALNACQDDNTMPGEEPGTAGTPTVVSASIGNEPDTRAQVKYGTKDPKEGEYFMWNTDDQFKAYNITAAGLLKGYTFNIDANYNEAAPSREADFSCQDFSATAGNKIGAFYGIVTYPGPVTDPGGKKGIRATIGFSLYSQQQTSDPGNADLKHLQKRLCMYAIGEAGENNTISRLSFHHLSALFRFTIRNQQDTDAKVKKIGISFNGQNIICQKKTVTLWTTDNTMTYTVDEADKQNAAELSLKEVNGINHATIASGSSYDCFLPVMPVAEEGNAASSPVITVTDENDNSKSLTIDGFTNVEIKPGMRYWFDITIKADGTLVQTFKTDYAWYTQDNNATEFSLSTPGELRALANLVNGTDEALNAASASGPVSFEGKTIRLAGDIDLGNEAWTPIGNDFSKPFKGTFNGGGHHISGLNVNTTESYAGLFGRVGGKVSNLRVSGKVKTTGQMAGGITGQLRSSSTVENCIFNGDVSGASYVGGIAGLNESGTIAGCYTKGSVEATNATAGGIAGKNTGTITTCYSEATVTLTGGGIAGQSNSRNSISHCYATGSVSGIWKIGGIIGRHSDGTVENCIALNPALTRTSGSDTEFGRIAGALGTDPMSSPTLTSCSAFEGMTIRDAGTDISATATGEHGTALTAAQCLTAATYTGLGFTAATAAANGWVFDSGATWTYLPWNKAFESFPGIQPADYRIAVPAHLNGGGVN